MIPETTGTQAAITPERAFAMLVDGNQRLVSQSPLPREPKPHSAASGLDFRR